MEPCSRERDLATLQSEVGAIFKRMDEQLTITRAVYDLAAELKVMNQSIDILSKGQDRLTHDVEELKAKPGRRWDSLIGALLAALASGLAGYILARTL